jgi:hypothetical protein
VKDPGLLSRLQTSDALSDLFDNPGGIVSEYQWKITAKPALPKFVIDRID